MKNAFPEELTKAINETIANLEPGTVGISRDCLWQLTVGKISRCPHAPRGTNAAWVARQEFDAIVSAKQFKSLVCG
jgi:hypothetical protein